MPKETFYRLSEIKRENIESAIVKELSRVSIAEMSINKIIYEANIPRGSFYQYFSDKEDAIRIVVNHYIEKEVQLVKEILLKNNGDVFKLISEMYDYIVEQYFSNYTILYINIFDFLRKQTHSVMSLSHQPKNDISEYINLDSLKTTNKEDINIIIKILSILTRSTILEVFRKRLTVKEGKEQLEREIRILQEGMVRD